MSWSSTRGTKSRIPRVSLAVCCAGSTRDHASCSQGRALRFWMILGGEKCKHRPRTPLQNKLSDLWALMDFAPLPVRNVQGMWEVATRMC